MNNAKQFGSDLYHQKSEWDCRQILNNIQTAIFKADVPTGSLVACIDSWCGEMINIVFPTDYMHVVDYKGLRENNLQQFRYVMYIVGPFRQIQQKFTRSIDLLDSIGNETEKAVYALK